MKIEFENITEFMEFIEHIQKENQPKKEEITTEEMSENKEWLYNNNLPGKINIIIDKINALEQKNAPVPKTRKRRKITKKDLKKQENLKMKYANCNLKLSTVRRLYPSGKFQLSNSQTSKYNINDLLKIRQYINKGCTWDDIANQIDMNINTLQRICYGIETGYYDKYFDEWQQLQANTYRNNRKTVPMVNNPEKRKDMGLS